MISLQRKILRLQEVGVIALFLKPLIKKKFKRDRLFFFQRQRMTFLLNKSSFPVSCVSMQFTFFKAMTREKELTRNVFNHRMKYFVFSVHF